MRLYPLINNWFDGGREVCESFLTPVPVETWILRWPSKEEVSSNPNSIHVLYLTFEPRRYKAVDLQAVFDDYDRVDYIFDYDRDIIKRCPNAIKTLGCYSYINKEQWSAFRNKKKNFSVSYVCTNKADTDNQRLRQVLWHDQHLIQGTPKRFFNSTRMPMTEDYGRPSIPDSHEGKDMMFSSMFSIAIENDTDYDFFSEKLIDCFATKTVPIYIGCPNIGDYFDTDGIIVAKSEQEVIDICNSLSPKMYQERIAAINRNHRLCKPFIGDVSARIRKTVKDNLFPDFVFDEYE